MKMTGWSPLPEINFNTKKVHARNKNLMLRVISHCIADGYAPQMMSHNSAYMDNIMMFYIGGRYLFQQTITFLGVYVLKKINIFHLLYTLLSR